MKQEVLQGETGEKLQERLKLIAKSDQININTICNDGDCLLCDIRTICQNEPD